MKYCILSFNPGIRADLGQNHGFDTQKEAIEHAKVLGLTAFSILPIGNAKDWANFEKKATPSVVKATSSEKVETQTT